MGLAIALALHLLLPSASRGQSPPVPASEGALRKETVVGPVRASVSLAPAHPLLGDALTLTLEVSADPGVEVRMPAFGEALGRFDVVDFAPKESRAPDGGTRAEQRYTLDAPMSGRQTVPPLAVEFVDRRAGAPTGTAGSIQELLTEALEVDVRSALPEGAVTASAALHPPLGPLDESAWPPPDPVARGAGLAALLAAVLGGGGALYLGLRARAGLARRSAHERALAALAALEGRGMPRGDAIDAFYVELSQIVRRYVEDRYGLRAPEWTTEELLREAFRGAAIREAHRPLLRDFLERCDRVKFAAARPTEDESREALAAARRFVDETREAQGTG